VLRGKPGQLDTDASTPGSAQAVKPTAIPAARNENPVRERQCQQAPPPPEQAHNSSPANSSRRLASGAAAASGGLPCLQSTPDWVPQPAGCGHLRVGDLSGQGGPDPPGVPLDLRRQWLREWRSIDGQHGRALQHARAGLARLGTGSAAVRLHSLEALAASRLGLDDKAGAALADAVRARDEASGDDDIHDLTGGMFTSTPAKQAYMAAMARTNLGQPPGAIAEASRAIELWTSGPAEECAAAALTVARIDVVTAHILLRDLDAASEALQPVLAIPSEQRTTIVARRLDSLERPLLTAPARKSALARDMASHIEAFRAGMPPPQLPAG
jgi:hypothetical protein